MDNRKIALYIRLSLEDSKTDSMSIQNQEYLLRQKLVEYPEYLEKEVLVFVDNGFSGTNFHRPAITELLDLVALGEITCIFVKDTSRFGRNALECNYYLDFILPLYKTRYIFVTENIDSIQFKESSGGANLALRYLIAEEYSKDISRKSKTAKDMKIKSGEFVTANPFYGYKLNDSKQMVIDDEVAPVIELIFQLVKDGAKILHVVKELYARKIPTPAQHKWNKNDKEVKLWSNSMIASMLRDERYTGMYIMGKRESLALGSKKQRLKDESQWVKIPDKYPVLIDKKLFNEVQGMLPNRPYKEREIQQYLFRGMVRCGVCGKALRRFHGKSATWFCHFGKIVPESTCSSVCMLDVDLHEKILYQLLKTAKKDNNQFTKKDTGTLSEDLGRLNHENRILYEKYVKQEITLENFTESKANITIELLKTKELLKTVQATTQTIDGTSKAEILSTFLVEKTLTESIINAMIQIGRAHV